MDVRVGLFVLLLLGANWCCDARRFAKPFPEMQIEYETVEIRSSEDVSKNELCTLCEQYTGQAIDYLSQNKTQIEIIKLLYQSCSQLHSYQLQCKNVVDYYAPLFFDEIEEIQPASFCQKVNLCQDVVRISTQLQEDSCGLCHRAVSEVLIKLKDPDTQLEIIEILLKACESTKDFKKKCKRMVFEYGPLILANTEQYLEKTDICVALHACTSPAAISSDTGETLLSDS